MSVLTVHSPKGEFAAMAARRLKEKDLKPSLDDGVCLVRAFLSIGSAERRQAVLNYVVEQARMDNVLGIPKSSSS